MSKSKNYQKFLSATIAVATVASSTVIPYNVINVEAGAPSFKDIVKGTYYYDAVIDLVEKGVIQGFEDGTFKPYQATTRGQVSAMIARALDLDDKKVTDPGFSDVSKNDRFYHSIAALVESGIVDGVTKDSFQPNRLVTRAEMAKMITNAFGLKQNKDHSVLFTDVPNNSWYAGFVKALHDNGVTIGKTETTFAPNESVHRGQLATFIYRAQQNKSRTQVIEKVTDSSVTINGQSYTVAQSLKELFSAKNNTALTGAKLNFESKDGVINKIDSLSLNSNGSASGNIVLDGGNAVIDGSVSVMGDYYEVKNLTINGDLKITDKVKNSFISEKLTVKGNTSIEEAKTSAASFSIAAENPKTKITIIFKDSTMATIEIAKEDVYFSATGSTKVETITLHANANITADPDVIIPKVDIQKGVTLVELNVTIKEIIIESNDEIKVTGKGNIDNVVINTDKKVTLDTRGQIKNLESKSENSKITVGENARITNITVPEGKKAEEVVQNFDQVKDQIEQVGGTKNPDYTPSEPVNSPSAPSSGGSGGGSSDGPTQPTADQSAANSVTNKITALPAVGSLALTNEIAVNEAKEAFEGLTPAQKELVITGNQTKLTEAVAKIAQLKADQVAAAAVTAQITALPAVDELALERETEVADVKSAFDNLTDSQKALVSTGNQTKLTEAVAKIAQLKADQVAAAAVTAQITALPAVNDITLDHETAVNEAKAAFETLTSSEKAFVIAENQTKVTEAVARIAQLKEADQVAAEAVTAKITDLPAVVDIVLDDEAEVTNAKIAFEALKKEQKALVSTENQVKLTDAFAKIALLKAGEGDVEAAAAVTEKIVALPDLGSLILMNEIAVNEAKEAFDGLSPTQKDLVDILNQSKLTEAVKKIDQLKVDQEAAAVVTEKIVALPLVSQITLHNEDVVSEAKVAFDRLTTTQQLLVSAENQTKLTDAEAKIVQLKADQEDAAKATAVTEAIKVLPAVSEITLSHETAINDAKAAFNTLTTEQKALVVAENQTKLTDAEAKIAQLKADQEDTVKATAASEKITALPAVSEITLAHETAINDAKAAFDALTTDQKALVGTENQTKLNNVVTRINELHDQTSNPTDPGNETEDFFDAGITEVEGRFGYVKLNLFNQGNYKVKYLVVNYNESHNYQALKAGDAVPEDAVEYKSGDEFILWTGSEVFAYQVDSNDKIVEPVDINEVWHTFPIDIVVDQEQSKLKIKVLVDPAGKTNEQLLNDVYLFSSSNAYKMDLSKGNWTSVDGIATVELSLDNMDRNVQYNVFVDGYQFRALTHVNHANENFKEEEEKTDLVMVKYAAKNLADEFGWFISGAVYEEVPVRDEDGTTYTTRKRIAEQDSVSIAKYKAEIIEREDELTTIEDLKNLVKEVNALPEIKGKVDIYKNAASAVEALYKEDRYDYEEDERLKENLTQEEIDHAKTAIGLVSDEFKEKKRLQYDIEYAQYLFVKKAVDAALLQYKSEVSLPENMSIGNSVSDLIYNGEVVKGLEIQINSIGNELRNSKDYQYVSGDAQYLVVNESGEIVLNELNTTGTSKTEYAQVTFYVGERYIKDKIIKINIPTTSTSQEKSAESRISVKNEVPFIIGHSDDSVLGILELSGTASVNDLVNAIVSEDGKIQNYEVKNAEGALKKATDSLVQGDKLIVTAENGLSKRIYAIEFPIIIDKMEAGELGHFTINVKNTNSEELQQQLYFSARYANNEYDDEVSFSLEQAKDEQGNGIANYYNVIIEGAQKDAFYYVNGHEKSVRGNQSIIWRSFEVEDAEATPDNTAVITNTEALSLTAENIQVKLSEDNNTWSDTLSFDGLTLGSTVAEDAEGNYKITFTTQGQFDGHLDHQEWVYINVLANGIVNRNSIEIRINEHGELAVY